MESCLKPALLKELAWKVLGKVTRMSLRVSQVSANFFCKKQGDCGILDPFMEKEDSCFIAHHSPPIWWPRHTAPSWSWRLPPLPACWHHGHQLPTWLRPSGKSDSSSSPGLLPSDSLWPQRAQRSASARHRVLWINVYMGMATREARAGLRKNVKWEGVHLVRFKGHWEGLPTPVQNSPSLPQRALCLLPMPLFPQSEID